jgi:hypothetical protein
MPEVRWDGKKSKEENQNAEEPKKNKQESTLIRFYKWSIGWLAWAKDHPNQISALTQWRVFYGFRKRSLTAFFILAAISIMWGET